MIRPERYRRSNPLYPSRRRSLPPWTSRQRTRRCILHPLIGVLDRACCWLPVPERHLRRIYDELGSQMSRHRPSDESAGVSVQHERRIEEASSGLHIGCVRYPDPISSRTPAVRADWIRGVGTGQRSAVPTSGASPSAPRGHPLSPALCASASSRACGRSGYP
jgi:hypothetical protein